MTKPNFFIVGAPKCGTTALSEYLRQHPNVFMALPKEPMYFTDYPYPRYRAAQTEHEYLALYREALPRHIAVGEASASYLYADGAIQRICDFESSAKIIVMLRNPADMVYSWHSQLVYSYEETERDFARAWDLQDIRSRQEGIPKHCRDYRVLLYRDVGRLGEQIERLLSVFQRDRVLILLMEEFARDTAGVYRRTLEFLGLPDDGRKTFERVNAAKTFDDNLFHRFAAQPPEWWLRTSGTLKKLIGVTHFGVLDSLRMKNVQEKPLPKLSAELRQRLIVEFAEDIDRLSAVIDVDLAHWKDGIPAEVATKGLAQHP